MKQSKCYISGAITNEPHHRFYFACADYCVRQMGYQPVQPCFNSPFLGIKCWTCYMIADLWVLMFCQKAYFMRNWTESKGARIEHAWAKLLRKKIIYETDSTKIVMTNDAEEFARAGFRSLSNDLPYLADGLRSLTKEKQ